MLTLPALLFVTSYLATISAERLRRDEQEMETLARTAILDRHRLEGVVHTAGLGMVLLARDLSVLWVNRRAAEWLGWERQGLGSPCSHLSASNGCPDCLAGHTLREGRALEQERTVRGPTGAVRHLRHATSPVRDGGGSVVQVVEVIEDVTERKALEDQAAHAGKLAALGRLAAGIAHEIGNPLSSLETRLHLLDRHPEPDFVHESVVVLSQQLERIDRIVRGVTQFARLPRPDGTATDVNAVVSEALHMVRLHRRSKRVTFEKELHAPLPDVRVGRDQIVQVLLNLLLNAVDATADGGAILVATSIQNGAVTISVRDSGAGMDAATMARIFEPFFTTKSDGTGLGLALSDSLVRAQGGHIEVESAPGSGSKFSVVLPAMPVTVPAARR